MKKKAFIFKDAVYWHDYETEENVKMDFTIQVLSPCADNGIILKKYRTIDASQVLEQNFDILFFDWGGMMLGNSLMEHFCRYIIKHATDNPSRFYVMVSSFTKEAMQDALEVIDDKPFNVFLEINDLVEFLK